MKKNVVLIVVALIGAVAIVRKLQAASQSPHAAGKITAPGVNIIPPDNGASGYSDLY
jgi:hypothetical protein